MIKVTLELDYPNMDIAMDTDPYLSPLLSSEKCIVFEHKEELPSIREFITKRNERIQELYSNMKIDPENVSAEIKEAIEKVAFSWVNENYYYHSTLNKKS